MKLEPANIICPKCGNGNYMRHLIGKNVGKLDMKCINCNSYFNFDELYKQKIAEVVKPATNYDRIISKSPEELAKWIAGGVLNLTGGSLKMATEASSRPDETRTRRGRGQGGGCSRKSRSRSRRRSRRVSRRCSGQLWRRG